MEAGVMRRATLGAGALLGVMIRVALIPGTGTTPRATKDVARGKSIVRGDNGLDADTREFG